jgi:hypothetical protein
MKIKKILAAVICVSAILGVGLFLIVPTIARGIIEKQLLSNPNNTVSTIDVSWGGPQIISGLHISENHWSSDVDVVISSSLFSLIFSDTAINVTAKGSAAIYTESQKNDSKETEPQKTSSPQPATTKQDSSNSVPPIKLAIELETLSIVGDEEVALQDVVASVDLDPGMHFVASLQSKSDVGGIVNIDCSAPNLFSKSGKVNWSTGGTCTIDITNSPIPTISGFGGWSILEMHGDVSSPNFNESLNVVMAGSFSEYDSPRGSAAIKVQVIPSKQNHGELLFENKAVVGSADFNGIPTSILYSIFQEVNINTTRDIGPLMDVQLRRSSQKDPIATRITARDIDLSGLIHQEGWAMTDIALTSTVNSKFLEDITQDKLSGDGVASLAIEYLLPTGVADGERSECFGTLTVSGDLQYLPTATSIESYQSTFTASMAKKTVETHGSVLLDGEETTFKATLNANNKEKLDGIDDLWKSVTSHWPSSIGEVTASNLPTVLLSEFIGCDVGVLLLHGPRCSGNAISTQSGHLFELETENTTFSGNLISGEEWFTGVQDATLRALLQKTRARELLGIQSKGDVIVNAKIASLDFDGNATFNATLDSDNMQTTMQGNSKRSTSGALDMHLATTSFPSEYISLLFREVVGTVFSSEIIVKDVFQNTSLTMAGTSSNTAFETSALLQNNKAFFQKNKPTVFEFAIDERVTKNLLKQLNPMLADILPNKHPIQLMISNGEYSFDNSAAGLSVDLVLQIGTVEMNCQSESLRLLTDFKYKTKDTILVQFEPIRINIRNGVATYKRFNFIVNNEVPISCSGTINYLTKKLQLKSLIPLADIGYNIKELHGLDNDIYVPVITAGTIAKPAVYVDPNFDVAEILSTLSSEPIEGVITSTPDAPNPLDLLEELMEQ